MKSSRTKPAFKEGAWRDEVIEVSYQGIVLQNDKFDDEILGKLRFYPVRKLFLDDCNLRDQEAQRLAEALTLCPTLTEIIFSRNQISHTP